MTDSRTTDAPPRAGAVVPLAPAGNSCAGKDLGVLRRYWLAMRLGAAVPRRADIDPRGLEPLLENALIAERIAPGFARLRIAGQHLGDLMGMEVRGMPLSAFIAPDHRDRLADALTDLFERPAILTLRLSTARQGARPALSGVLMLLPLRSDLGDVSRALGCLVTDGAIGRAPRRFRIDAVQVEPVGAAVSPAAPAVPRLEPAGFAEAPRRYDAPARPDLAGERPYLRLVRGTPRDTGA